MAPIRAKASLESLPAIREYVLDSVRMTGVSDIPPKLDLILEELLVNTANHAYGSQDGDIEIDCRTDGAQEAGDLTITMVVRDWGPPFNPLMSDQQPTSNDISERPIGGVGLLLVTNMADECSYAREKGQNILTLLFSA